MDSIMPHFAWVKEYWHIVTGVVLATWWLAVRIKRNLFKEYATIDMMYQCKNAILDEIKSTARENKDTHEELKNLLIAHIDK
jgi:hypothetical protein